MCTSLCLLEGVDRSRLHLSHRHQLHMGFGPLRCRANGAPVACGRLHFRQLLFPWTDVSLGNCSYLDTCRHMHNCKFVHYELDQVRPRCRPQAPRCGKR